MAVSRLGLNGLPSERYRTTQFITGSGTPSAGAATTNSSGTLGAVSRLGLMGVGRERYLGFVAKEPAVVIEHTGTGTPQATTATTNSLGEVVFEGTGAPQAVTATASGTGIRIVTGYGGFGWIYPLHEGYFNPEWWVSSMHTGRPSMATENANSRFGSGTLEADTATVTANASLVKDGSGTLAPALPFFTGAIHVSGKPSGTGVLLATTATLTGIIAVTGTGTLAATIAAISGVGGKGINSFGNIQAVPASMSGVGIKLGSWDDTTDTDGGWTDTAGGNLITNGIFDTNANAWVGFGSTLLSYDGSRLKVEITNTAHTPKASQSIITVPGQSYTLTYEQFDGLIQSPTNDWYDVFLGTFLNGNDILYQTFPDEGTRSIEFTATTPETYLTLGAVMSTKTVGDYWYLDNVMVRANNYTATTTDPTSWTRVSLS